MMSYLSYTVTFCWAESFKTWINVIKYFFYIRDTRASVLEQSLRKLGVERLTKDDVQKMQWEALEAKIGNWIHYMRIAVRMCHICLWLFNQSILSPILIVFPTFYTAGKRSNCCLLGKGKFVIKFLTVQTLSKINALLMWLQTVCQCY